jgi:hypothetical protein
MCVQRELEAKSIGTFSLRTYPENYSELVVTSMDLLAYAIEFRPGAAKYWVSSNHIFVPAPSTYIPPAIADCLNK